MWSQCLLRGASRIANVSAATVYRQAIQQRSAASAPFFTRTKSLWSRAHLQRALTRPLATAPNARPVALEDIDVVVATLVEADKKSITDEALQTILDTIQQDSELVVRHALSRQGQVTGDAFARPQELSLVLCDDVYMRKLNKQWRGKDSATDVLSFEVPPDEFDLDLPVRVLGDILISVDTAQRQADERAAGGVAYTLTDEVRVLLVHGMLHLLGYDHELGPEAAQAMAQEEQRIMGALAWKGEGLIEAAGLMHAESIDSNMVLEGGSDDEDDDTVSTFDASDLMNPIQIVCLDMDGTLLNSASQVSPGTAECLKRNLGAPGRTIMIATGKARPAAIAACAQCGLSGPGGLVHENGPGIFLQGLAVYGPDGALLPGTALPRAVVREAFEFAERIGVPCVAFLGDTCATVTMAPELEELHTRYYEPLAQVMTLDDIVDGPEVKKVLLMSTADVIENRVLGHFDATLPGSGATWTQALDTMLEIVPEGVDKWTGLQQYLEATGQDAANVMACGDGLNDYELLLNVGFSVAMDNAVEEVAEIADFVTASNDEDGVAAAIDRFVR